MSEASTKEPLIGVIDAGTRTVKFCVFRSQHTKEIAEYAVDITPHTPKEGWFEEDPLEILAAVRNCMKNVLGSVGGSIRAFSAGSGYKIMLQLQRML